MKKILGICLAVFLLYLYISLNYIYVPMLTENTAKIEKIVLISHNKSNCYEKILTPDDKNFEQLISRINHKGRIQNVDGGYYHEREYEIIIYYLDGTKDILAFTEGLKFIFRVLDYKEDMYVIHNKGEEILQLMNEV